MVDKQLLPLAVVDMSGLDWAGTEGSGHGTMTLNRTSRSSVMSAGMREDTGRCGWSARSGTCDVYCICSGCLVSDAATRGHLHAVRRLQGRSEPC